MTAASLEPDIPRAAEQRGTIIRAIGWGLRLFLGMLLVYSALLKLYDPLTFLDALYKYRLVGEGTGIALAFVVPVIELAVGGTLLARTSRVAAVVAAVMLVIFTLAQVSAWQRGLAIDCGCFGDTAPGGSLVGPWTIARTGFLALVAGVVAFASSPAVASDAATQ